MRAARTNTGTRAWGRAGALCARAQTLEIAKGTR